MMSWQADKSGSQASLFGANGGLKQTAATPVRLGVCARSVCFQTRTRVRQWVLVRKVDCIMLPCLYTCRVEGKLGVILLEPLTSSRSTTCASANFCLCLVEFRRGNCIPFHCNSSPSLGGAIRLNLGWKKNWALQLPDCRPLG